MGRFLQRDPNETTLPIVTAIAFNGDALAIVLGVFSPQAHYADGLNLYAYLGSNPLNLRDPLGLVFDPFGDVDDLIGDIQGERAAAGAAAAAQIGMFMNTALMIGKMAFSFMPGADALNLMFLIAQGKGVGWTDVIGAGLDLAGPIGKIGAAFVGAIGGYHLGVKAIKWVRANSHGLIGAVRGAQRLAFKGGKAAEDYLANLLGGLRQVRFSTSDGARVIDVVANGVGHEAKVGFVRYSSDVIRQIEKDAELIGAGQLDAAQWHFFRSGHTGMIGADERILSCLRQNGIGFTIHD